MGRQQKLREEEAERKGIEEERRKEAEEAEQRRKENEKKEGKYAGLKPAAAMFQRALDAKGTVQKSISGGDRRVTTLQRGTISEIRSKIFDQKKTLDKSKSDTQVKSAPKKLIIPSVESKDPIKADPVLTKKPENEITLTAHTNLNEKEKKSEVNKKDKKDEEKYSMNEKKHE